MKKIILFMLAIAGLYSCEQETIPTYSGDDQIYFKYADEDISSYIIDSAFIRFGYDIEIKPDTIYKIGVKLQGKLTDYDRPVALEFINSQTTATVGRDIEFVQEESFVPAGSIYGYVAVKVYNNENLANDAVLKAALRLVPNEYFKTDYITTRIKPFNKDSVVATEFRLLFDNANEMPNFWANATYTTRFNMFFGAYSRKKFALLCELFKFNREYFTYDTSLTAAQITTLYNSRFPSALTMAWSKSFNLYLTEYKNTHDGQPLLEDDGTEMKGGIVY
ncbi:MAG: DUF4843 domain-containing protein [Dysgonamonadaceae bacterium]|nr:DUF4843 domain-containing protein [Dysgonamonadaceae bacterium]